MTHQGKFNGDTAFARVSLSATEKQRLEATWLSLRATMSRENIVISVHKRQFDEYDEPTVKYLEVAYS